MRLRKLTRGYVRSREVTRGYESLREVTWNNGRLREVKEAYVRLREATWDYGRLRNLWKVTRGYGSFREITWHTKALQCLYFHETSNFCQTSPSKIFFYRNELKTSTNDCLKVITRFYDDTLDKISHHKQELSHASFAFQLLSFKYLHKYQ